MKYVQYPKTHSGETSIQNNNYFVPIWLLFLQFMLHILLYGSSYYVIFLLDDSNSLILMKANLGFSISLLDQ